MPRPFGARNDKKSMKEGIEKIAESKSRTFLAFCFSFIFGVGLFSFKEENAAAFYLYILIFVVLFFLIIFWSDKIKRFIFFCFLFFLLGGLRFLWSIPNNNPENIRYYNGESKEITGWVSAEPEYQTSAARYVLATDLGKVLMTMPLQPQYEYGDEFILQCSLQSPKDMIDSTFIYSRYLARSGIYSLCANPKIKSIIKDARGNWFRKNILRLKTKVNAQVESLWPEPEASLMAGLLYGARSGLPKDLLDNFSRVGITHIIAISGYNISIIAVVLMNVLILIGFWRQQAFWIVLSVIFLFVVFTGASASVVRAGVMGILVLVAGQLGRLSRVGNVLVSTATVMLLFNPFVLIWDAGFQLSFLATLGLVYLSPLLEKYYGQILSATLSAIIATLPFILFQFGRLSIVAPLVNVLVLWVIPWLMLFGFLAVMIGFLFFPLGQVVAWLAGLGLKYVIILTNWFGSKSWAAVEISLPWWGMILLYILMIWSIKKYEAKNKDFAIGQGV